MSEHKEPIPSMIYNASIGGHVTSSQQIIDEEENKEQSQINAEVKLSLGQVDNRINEAKDDIIGGASSNGNTLKKIEDRVSPLESKIGSGGSVDARIAAAKSEIIGNATSECDTLEEAEEKINANASAISAEILRSKAAEQILQAQYNALTQSDIIVGALPSSGTKNKIYRVPGTNTYSDYMWNGSSFVKMATYDNAIDNVPTAESGNLVKSGGVFKVTNPLNIDVYGRQGTIDNYGCTVTSTLSGISGVAFYGANSFCEYDGIVYSITATFSGTGNMTFAVISVSENRATVIKEYQVAVTEGINTILVDDLGIEIKKGQMLVVKRVAEQVGVCFGINASVLPVGYNVMPDGFCEPRADNVYFSFAWSVKSKIEGLIKEYEEIKQEIYGTTEDIINNYGYNGSTSHDSSNGVLYIGSYDPCTKDGIIKTISGYFGASGTMIVATCSIDQNGKGIIGTEYNVAVPSANYCSINVSDLNIPIKKGQLLVAKVNNNTLCQPMWNVNADIRPKGFSVFPNYDASPRNDGVYWSFAWSVITKTDGIIADIDKLDVRVTALEEKATNNNTYLTDTVTGVRYKLIVSNGVLSLEELTYQKVLVLGNSITIHGIIPSWPADNRGMAATKQEYDFCGILKTQLDAQEIKRLNIADWERDFTVNLNTLIGQNLTSETDLVIIRLGENVTDSEGFESGLSNLIQYIQSISANAKIVITGCLWGNATKEEAIINVCQTYNLDYVQIYQFDTEEYLESIGHYTYNSDYTSISEITNSAVAGHPSNVGMCAIANAILNVLGYPLSENTYSLKYVTLGGITGQVYELDD